MSDLIACDWSPALESACVFATIEITPTAASSPIGLARPPADTPREPVTIATTHAPTSTISTSR